MQESLAQKFNESATLAEKFNEIITAEHNAFPKELENLVVFLIPPSKESSKTTVFASNEITKHLTNNIAAVKEAIRERTNYLNTKKTSGVAHRSYFLGGKKIKIIALNENPNNTDPTPSIQKVTNNLLHEIGHIVVENGFSSDDHRAECAADTYGSFGNIRTFGKKTDFFEYYGNRASTIVLGTSPIHYTNGAIEQVKQLSEKIDISALSPPETAKLAKKIAKENSLDKKTLKKISSAFFPVKNDYEKIGKLNFASLRKCADIMLKHEKNPYIFEAGERFLNRPDIKEHLKNKAKTDPYWKKTLDFIEKHEIKPPKKTLYRRFSGFVMRGS